jgi:hypothetical protein
MARKKGNKGSQLTSTKDVVILGEPPGVACPQEPLGEKGDDEVASN